MLDKSKQIHRPERLKGYDYTQPGYYFITLTAKVRGEDIFCSIEAIREAEIMVGPAPLGRPIPQQLPDSQPSPLIRFTPAGETVQELIERIPEVYQSTYIDCYIIMPDHVHLLLWLGEDPAGRIRNDDWKSSLEERDGPARGPGPTSVPKIVNVIKSLTTRRLGESIWQEHYYDHVIRNQQDLDHVRQYILNNPLKWILDKE